MNARENIETLIVVGNIGGAWQLAEDAYGKMTYVEFLERFVWGA